MSKPHGFRSKVFFLLFFSLLATVWAETRTEAEISDGGVSSRIVTEVTPLAPGTRYEEDATLAWGEERTVSEGTAGKVTRRMLRRYEHGSLVQEVFLSEDTVEAEDRVIAYGTQSKNASVKVIDYTGGTVETEEGTLPYRQCLSMTATAYTAGVGRVDTVTATGTTVRRGVVAVDPKVIPLGSRVYVSCTDGTAAYGIAVAEDTGVRGNIIDLYMEDYDTCIRFGVRDVRVYLLDAEAGN